MFQLHEKRVVRKRYKTAQSFPIDLCLCEEHRQVITTQGQMADHRTQNQKTETDFYNIDSSFSSLFARKNMTFLINYPNICNSYYFYNHIRY